MNCKYCGYPIPKAAAICPHCKRMLTQEQLKQRKEMNGYMTPYAERIEKLQYEMHKNNIEKNEQHINIKPYALILIVLLIIILIVWIF